MPYGLRNNKDKGSTFFKEEKQICEFDLCERRENNCLRFLQMKTETQKVKFLIKRKNRIKGVFDNEIIFARIP